MKKWAVSGLLEVRVVTATKFTRRRRCESCLRCRRRIPKVGASVAPNTHKLINSILYISIEKRRQVLASGGRGGGRIANGADKKNWRRVGAAGKFSIFTRVPTFNENLNIII